MIGMLGFRSAKRSARESLIYIGTMAAVAALMFAFHSLLFTKEVRGMSEMFGVMAVVLLMATGVVIGVSAWLIGYLVGFRFRTRSREFALYLLAGMKKNEVARLYFLEHGFLGILSFGAGIFAGVFLQQLLMIIFTRMLGRDFQISAPGFLPAVLLTGLCFGLCYLLALVRSHRQIRRMNLREMLGRDRENEPWTEGKCFLARLGFLISLAVLILYLIYVNSDAARIKGVLLGMPAAFGACYGVFLGLAAWILVYIKKKRRGIYRGASLFLLRQLSAQIRTMGVTMGTLSLLLIGSLAGMAVSLMLNDWQTQQLEENFPFDLSIHQESPKASFKEEFQAVEAACSVRAAHIYQIYENGTQAWNDYFYTHLPIFGERYWGQENIVPEGYDQKYYRYDTYMKLSDYNCLREMLGYEPVALERGTYLLHTKERTAPEQQAALEVNVLAGEARLKYAGVRTEPFCQNGHNGADYVIVVTDEDAEAGKLRPYYSQMVVMTDHAEALSGLGILNETAENGNIEAVGTDLLSYSGTVFLRPKAVAEMKSTLILLYFPLIYMGLVFLCTALTVLSVQQLNNGKKYRAQYGLLHRLGEGKRGIFRIVVKQQLLFYLAPALLAAVFGAAVCQAAGRRFVLYTGMKTAPLWYFGMSALFFLGIYVIYFGAALAGFLREVEAGG